MADVICDAPNGCGKIGTENDFPAGKCDCGASNLKRFSSENILVVHPAHWYKVRDHLDKKKENPLLVAS